MYHPVWRSHSKLSPISWILKYNFTKHFQLSLSLSSSSFPPPLMLLNYLQIKKQSCELETYHWYHPLHLGLPLVWPAIPLPPTSLPRMLALKPSKPIWRLSHNSFTSTTAANSSFPSAMDTKLAVCFKQFCREQYFVSGGELLQIRPLTCQIRQLDDRFSWRKVIFVTSTPCVHHAMTILIAVGSLHVHSGKQRLEFARLSDGDDLLAWLYKANQYFAYYHTPDQQKMVSASFHLKNESLQWFRWRGV